jgi:hypothetical protein
MRVLRRIAGEPRFGHCEHTDYQIRQQVGFCSLDCCLVRARLRYVGRVIAAQPKSLLAALWLTRLKTLPWMELLRDDMKTMYDCVGDVRYKLPHPGTDAMAWFCFARDRPDEWTASVSKINFLASVFDQHEFEPLVGHVQNFACDLCPAPGPSFSTAKARDQHLRVKHGITSSVKMYIDGSGICPICMTNFRSRSRVIAHVSDTRRPKCRNKIFRGRVPQTFRHPSFKAGGR